MPSYIVKVNKEDDLYVYWSDIAEAPHCWGTREEVSKYMISIGENNINELDSRFARADENGTSAYSWADTYGWETSGFIYMQLGFLRRNKLGEFLASYAPVNGFVDRGSDFDLSLLEPFDDDCC